MTDWQGNVDAFSQTAGSLVALGAVLTDEEWGRATECPGWAVSDQYLHILSVEEWLAAPGDGPAITTDDMEAPIAALGDLSRPEVLRRLAEVIERRVAWLRTADLAVMVDTPFGARMPYGDFVRSRAFDVWTHEQDVRRAVGRPGNLRCAAADATATILSGSLPFVVGKRAKAEPGRTVRFEVDDRAWQVVVGDDGRARFGDGDPDVTLHMDWETFARLGTGRCAPDAANVQIDGDPTLATRILNSMNVTP